MSIAELCGKLSPETAHDRMEDLLTSDAFGTMYYVGWHDGFRNWLHEAQSADERTQTIQQFLRTFSIQKVMFAFWPQLPNRRKPDLALLFLYEDGTARMLIVEVKYESGPTDFEVEDPEANKGLTGSQLVDQMVGFARADRRSLVERWFPAYGGSSEPLDFAHLFVTTDRVIPHRIYEEASQRLSSAGISDFPCPVFWLSWRSLARNLEPYIHTQDCVTARLMGHLVALMERKEITDKPFAAFSKLEWSSPIPSQGFWQTHGFFRAQNYPPVSMRESSMEGDGTPQGDHGRFCFWKRDSRFADGGYARFVVPKIDHKLVTLFWRLHL